MSDAMSFLPPQSVETCERIWRAVSQGLPLPPECARVSTDDFAHKLLHVAIWNDHADNRLCHVAR